MNTAVNVNVVHESEAQRQFARVKLPARIRYIGANREGVDARLLDLSAGGFAFTASGAPIQPGDLYKGKLLFQVDSISFSSKWSSGALGGPRQPPRRLRVPEPRRARWRPCAT